MRKILNNLDEFFNDLKNEVEVGMFFDIKESFNKLQNSWTGKKFLTLDEYKNSSDVLIDIEDKLNDINENLNDEFLCVFDLPDLFYELLETAKTIFKTKKVVNIIDEMGYIEFMPNFIFLPDTKNWRKFRFTSPSNNSFLEISKPSKDFSIITEKGYTVKFQTGFSNDSNDALYYSGIYNSLLLFQNEYIDAKEFILGGEYVIIYENDYDEIFSLLNKGNSKTQELSLLNKEAIPLIKNIIKGLLSNDKKNGITSFYQAIESNMTNNEYIKNIYNVLKQIDIYSLHNHDVLDRHIEGLNLPKKLEYDKELDRNLLYYALNFNSIRNQLSHTNTLNDNKELINYINEELEDLYELFKLVALSTAKIHSKQL